VTASIRPSRRLSVFPKVQRQRSIASARSLALHVLTILKALMYGTTIPTFAQASECTSMHSSLFRNSSRSKCSHNLNKPHKWKSLNYILANLSILGLQQELDHLSALPYDYPLSRLGQGHVRQGFLQHLESL
jgi:hypothetical protein